MSSDFTIIHKYLMQCSHSSLRNASAWVLNYEGSRVGNEVMAQNLQIK